MDKKLLDLVKQIRHELSELEIVVERVEQGWQRAKQSNDDLYVDSVVLNLYGFYSRMEDIFEVIAIHVDGEKPSGKNWHQLLLQQMVADKHGQRPAIISERSFELLDNYRSFYHVVRNIYTLKFDLHKIEQLVRSLPMTYASVNEELLHFARLL